jgi:hypothetical protein
MAKTKISISEAVKITNWRIRTNNTLCSMNIHHLSWETLTGKNVKCEWCKKQFKDFDLNEGFYG